MPPFTLIDPSNSQVTAMLSVTNMRIPLSVMPYEACKCCAPHRDSCMRLPVNADVSRQGCIDLTPVVCRLAWGDACQLSHQKRCKYPGEKHRILRHNWKLLLTLGSIEQASKIVRGKTKDSSHCLCLAGPLSELCCCNVTQMLAGSLPDP